MDASSSDPDATQPMPPSPGAKRTPGDGPVVERRRAAAPQDRDQERYAILSEHGRGGLGRVSRAHDRLLGRDVAIKELLRRDPESEARFAREARITARLEHPGIVAVHEAGAWADGTPFYAMRLVSGRPLRELLDERELLDDRLGLLHHVLAVADAIAYAHRRGVVHRDLKPSNIIIGEFGETIVIDWGLAKDLAVDEPTASADGPSPAAIALGSRNELTVAGTVLGTPAYMAPEQQRGEPVDRRADVFAIGVLLWELCADTRQPPADRRERHRALRRAGIDRDLATIIDKALAPDPAARYADAGALAADLKAFKAGSRITARTYSPLAVLAHWVRRHRGLAAAALGLAVVAAAVAVLWIRGLAEARDRADAARRTAEAESAARILDQAELLLTTDPTAAAAMLARYHGDDHARADALRAKAYGLGVAHDVWTPHNGSVWFSIGEPSGAVVSIGEDNRLVRTTAAGSVVLASDVTALTNASYAQLGHKIAYALSTRAVAVVDLRTGARVVVEALPATSPRAMREIDLSPDGAHLAVADNQDRLSIWPVTPGARSPREITLPGLSRISFATSDRIVALAGEELVALALQVRLEPRARATFPGLTVFEAGPDGVAVGTADGRLILLSRELGIQGSISVCGKAVRDLRRLAGDPLVGFACQPAVAAIAGIARIDSEPAVVESLVTHGPARLFSGLEGRYLAFTDESTTARVYDSQSQRFASYAAGAGTPSHVAPPTAAHPYLVIASNHGALRRFAPPDTSARVVARIANATPALTFTGDGAHLVATSADGTLHLLEVATGALHKMHGHHAVVRRLMAQGAEVLSFGYDGTARVWGQDGAVRRVLADHANVVEGAVFLAGDQVASVGDDGRLLLWAVRGSDARVLMAQPSPLLGVELLAHGTLAVLDAQGAVWEVELDGTRRAVHAPNERVITEFRTSNDGRYLATGDDAGEVTIYETANWGSVRSLHVGGRVRRIQLDPRNRDIVVATEPPPSGTGQLYVFALEGERAARWQARAEYARDLRYSPDGEVLGVVGADGGSWLCRLADATCAYAPDHDAAALAGRFSPDGAWFASISSRGTLVVRSVDDTLRAAPKPTKEVQ